MGSAAYLGGVLAPYLFSHPPSMRKRVALTYLIAGNGYLLMGLVPFVVLSGWVHAGVGLVLLLAFYAFTCLSNMSASMGYRSIIAQALHPDKQLTDWGRIFFWGLIMGIPGGMIAGKLHSLQTMQPLTRYGISLVGAFIVLQTGNLALLRLRSVRPAANEAKEQNPWRSVLGNDVFRRFMVGRMLLASQVVLTVFLSVYARAELGFQEGSVALLGTFQLAGIAVGSRLFSYQGQRTTAVHPAAAGAGCVVTGLALSLLFKNEVALWGAVFLGGMGTASRFLSDYALPLALVGEHKALPFYSVGMLLFATAQLAFSLLAGYAVARFTFAPVAVAALLLSTASLIWFLTMLARAPRTSAQVIS